MKNKKNVLWVIEKYLDDGKYRCYLNPLGLSMVSKTTKKVEYCIPQVFESRAQARAWLKTIKFDKYFPNETYKIGKFQRTAY